MSGTLCTAQSANSAGTWLFLLYSVVVVFRNKYIFTHNKLLSILRYIVNCSKLLAVLRVNTQNEQQVKRVFQNVFSIKQRIYVTMKYRQATKIKLLFAITLN
jgi:hypothetical protein